MALAGATSCRRGDLTWRTRGKNLRTKREWEVIFGRRGRADRRTACRMEADGRTSGHADESGWGADRAN